jgi:hypothetical protein
MRFKSLILGGAAALLLSTGLTGVALADAPNPSTTPSAPSDPGSPVATPRPAEPAPAPGVPTDAEPSYTG